MRKQRGTGVSIHAISAAVSVRGRRSRLPSLVRFTSFVGAWVVYGFGIAR